MHAYEEITKARSWRIIASHPDHARHETQESGSFTLSGLRSRTSKALRLTTLYHQSEHSRGPTSFPFPSSSARSVARTARCLGDNSNSQTLISGEASLGMFGLPQRGKGAEVESILCSLCLSAPLRQSRVSLQLSDAMAVPISLAKASGSLTPFRPSNAKTQECLRTRISEIGFRFSYKTPCRHPLSNNPLGRFPVKTSLPKASLPCPFAPRARVPSPPRPSKIFHHSLFPLLLAPL